MPKAVTKNPDEALQKKVVALRNDSAPWPEIAGSLGISQGKAMLLHLQANVKPGDRITAQNEEGLAKKIVAARDDQQLSWGQIMARSGLPESRLRKIYEDTTGTSTKGNRIGKGGRFPAGESAPAKANGSAKKAVKATKGTTKAAKKATVAKKAAASKKSGPQAGTVPASKKSLTDMTLDELRERLSGRTIVVGSQRAGGPDRKIGVALVKSLDGTEMNFTNDKGQSATVDVAFIKKAGR